jgi:Na+-translocating ferredoxin:NAD+ oxidoreductase RnfG subunit
MREPTSTFNLFPAALIAAAALPAVFTAPSVFAADYLSAADAQKLMFPDATAFEAVAAKLTPEQQKKIEAASGTPVNTGFWTVTAARSGDRLLGYVVSDAVVGKFQMINYAVAFAPDGHIRDVEILSYREAHGGEVRSKPWRNQFVGKDASAALAIDNDIANISGATLSCTHLSDGIRRLAHYVQAALPRS